MAFNNFSRSSMSIGVGDLVKLTHLNLSYCYLSGNIPSTISHLSKLVTLDLSSYSYWNMEQKLELSPLTWKKLIHNATNLRELYLDDVNMSSIRESSLSLLKNLSSSLVSLSLVETQLQGNLSSDILSLPNLQKLDLSFNQYLSGEISPLLSNLTHLIHCNLAYNNFSGSIPNVYGNLIKLEFLSLSGNNLAGQVPSSLFHLPHLSILRLSFNKLNGPIPIEITKRSKLSFVDLRYNMLNGTIPQWCYSLPSLFQLGLSNNHLTGFIGEFSTCSLQYLSLSNNNLQGHFPNSIFELQNLTILDLSSTNLSGVVDFHQFSKLNKLTSLDLSHNSFLSINIDSSVDFILPNLEELDLSSANINSFPKFLAQLPNLQLLDLSNNNLQGHFPNSIFELQNLTHLGLSSTNLSGVVDFHQFSKLNKLTSLVLSHNSFLSINIDSSADSILPNLDYLNLSSANINSFPKFLARNLEELDLSNNNIHGEIPKWFHKKLLNSWNEIWYIDLSFNKLQGHLPIPPHGIEIFLLSNNNFTGDISSTFCNASFLNVLNLAHNNLTGMIPQCLGTLTSLNVLDMQMNNLYGSIPRTFSKGNEFETIKLNGNQLEGPLPQSLAHCSNLEVLDLADNNVEDTFPNWLEILPKLQVLSLRSNNLHGAITCSSIKHSFPKLRIFDVSNNNFSGPLPTSCIQNFQGMMNLNDIQIGLQYMGKANYYNDSVVVIMKGFSMKLTRILTTFTTIDLSNNMFEGKIPQVIGELNSLKGLNLSNNGITGSIPQSLGRLRKLEWLDLSCNQLTGEIPVALTNLNFLSVLNLSQNHLEGIIPTGQQFDTFGNDSYEGNTMLCGFPLSKSCKNDEDLPPHSTSEDEEESGFGWKAVAIGYACGAISGLLLGYNVFFFAGKPQWLARHVEHMFNIRLKRTNNRASANRKRMN